MGPFNRREMVAGLGGLVAGVATLPPAGAVAAGAGAAPDPRRALDSIRLAGEAERTFLTRLGRRPTPPAQLPPGRRPGRAVEARVVAHADAAGQPFALGLAFDCCPRVVNHLSVEGAPLLARRFCFSADAIRWSPGRGLPVYSAYSPRYEYVSGARYPGAKWHQVVPLVDGRGYFAGCQPTDICEAAAPGAVCFDVNDSMYDDNEGSYTITIWSWS